MKHTPTPWKYEYAPQMGHFIKVPDGLILAKIRELEEETETKANAERIVECVNLFHDIVDPTAYMKNLNAMLLKAGNAVNENESLKRQLEKLKDEVWKLKTLKEQELMKTIREAGTGDSAGTSIGFPHVPKS